MTAIPTPKPGPRVQALRPIPVVEQGLNAEDPERRRRIVQGLLPWISDADDLLMVAAWIETGDDEGDET